MIPITHNGAPLAPRPQAGFTLVELCIVMVIVCLLVTMAVPTFRKAVEQARMDAASAGLRTVWSAQRVYWLENRRFAASLADLQAMDLVDASVAASGANPAATFVYAIPSADASHFLATATRTGSRVWSGGLQVDQDGAVTGSVADGHGLVLTPTQ
jgi:type IV pilus assembly protein PilE